MADALPEAAVYERGLLRLPCFNAQGLSEVIQTFSYRRLEFNCRVSLRFALCFCMFAQDITT